MPELPRRIKLPRTEEFFLHDKPVTTESVAGFFKNFLEHPELKKRVLTRIHERGYSAGIELAERLGNIRLFKIMAQRVARDIGEIKHMPEKDIQELSGLLFRGSVSLRKAKIRAYERVIRESGGEIKQSDIDAIHELTSALDPNVEKNKMIMVKFLKEHNFSYEDAQELNRRLHQMADTINSGYRIFRRETPGKQ